MKSSTGVIVGVVLAAVIILGVVEYQKNLKNADSGSLYIGVTDATADINGVTDVDMSVKKVEVYSATKGWTTVSTSSQKYSLLALKASGQTQLHAKGKVNAGSYDKVRVTLGDTTVRTKAKGDMKATLPSSHVVIDGTVKVEEGKSTYVKLDFLADKSLHVTSDGQYVFAPVVKAESRSNASVAVSGDNNVTATGGTVDATATAGMDLEGKSRMNFQLITGQSLKIESSSGNEVKFMLGGKVYTAIDSDTTGTEASSSGGINTDGSLKVDGALDTTKKIDVKTPAVNTEVDATGGIKLVQ
jgi:hypothetical protein